MTNLPQPLDGPPTPVNSQDDDAPNSRSRCGEPLTYITAELLCHTVKFLTPMSSDVGGPTTADSGVVSFRHVGSAEETDARKDLRTAHRQSYIPAIGNNNGQEPLVVAKELLSSAFKRKPSLYLQHPNAPAIDLTLICRPRPNGSNPDGARSRDPHRPSFSIYPV